MTVLKATFVMIALLALAGCTLRPTLVAAHVTSGDEGEIVEVIIRASDAMAIKDREMYFSIVVVDCQDNQNRFPVEPYIAEQLAADFDFPIEGELVTVHGSMPGNVLVDIPTPCVLLQGGSYFSGKIESAPIPLVRQADE